jgi:hypothetical protein
MRKWHRSDDARVTPDARIILRLEEPFGCCEFLLAAQSFAILQSERREKPAAEISRISRAVAKLRNGWHARSRREEGCSSPRFVGVVVLEASGVLA